MSPPREAPAQACVLPVESRVIGVPRAVRGGACGPPANPGWKQGHGTRLGTRATGTAETRGELRGHFSDSDDHTALPKEVAQTS